MQIEHEVLGAQPPRRVVRGRGRHGTPVGRRGTGRLDEVKGAVAARQLHGLDRPQARQRHQARQLRVGLVAQRLAGRAPVGRHEHGP